MTEAHGWSDGRQLTFDGDRLNRVAKELLAQNHGYDLAKKLADALVPPDVFGEVPDGKAAAARLEGVFTNMRREIERLGIDIDDLAARTLAAGTLAHDVDAQTRAAARFDANPDTGRHRYA